MGHSCDWHRPHKKRHPNLLICDEFYVAFRTQNDLTVPLIVQLITIDTRTTLETPKYSRRPRDQYTAQIVNTLKLSAPHQIEFKKNLSNLVISLVKFQTTNTCTYVAAKKWSHCETVVLWNSLGTCKTSSIPLRCHWKPNCQRRSQVCHLWLFCWYTRLPCAFAPIFMVRSYFQCCCQSIKKICIIIEMVCIDNIDFVNIAFQSVACIHAEWAISGDDVGAASRRLTFLSKYRDRP